MFNAVFYYLQVYKKYLGNRLYITFGLTLMGSLTEGLGITMLLPLILLLDIGADVPGGMSMPPEASGIERILQDIVTFLGIDDSLVGILIFIAIIFAFKGLLKFIEQTYKVYLQTTLLRETRAALFDQYTTMTYGYYNKHNAGHFINLINAQVGGLMGSFGAYNQFLSTIIATVSYFVFAFLVSWQFATMAVFAGLLVLYIFRRLNHYVQGLSRKTSTESGILNHLIVQSMQAFKYVASTDQMMSLREQVIPSIYRLTGYQMRTGVARAVTTSVREPLAITVLVLIIAVQIAVLEQPIAPIMVSLLLIYRAIAQVMSIQSSWQGLMSLIGSLEKVEEEFERVREHQQSDGEQIVAPFEHQIELRDVCFAYDDEPVLQDVNLTIPANRIVAFVGESGAGKSTLVDMLTLMLRPTHGQILIDGLPHDTINLSSWRRQIGYVSQDTVIFDDTVANNICMWRGDYNTDADLRERVEAAAERAYAREFIEHLPEGFHTRVGDRGIRLSGGQRQRLFIARELFKHPRLLILDEATSALDSESEHIIKESIDALKGQTTVVIIAHRLSTIKSADHIYVLDAGRIIEEGSYEALTATNDSHFQRMVALQGL